MIEALRLFNEKADKLDRLSYTQWFRQNRGGFTVRNLGGGLAKAEVRAPNDEAVDAFVLTLRFFIQNNESISISRIADLYEQSGLSVDLRERVANGRAELNKFLDSSSQITISGETLAKRRILDVFLWGGLAHANVEKKKTFDQWVSDPILFPVMQMAFHSVIVELLRFILWLRSVNDSAFEELGAHDGST
jgi:hypothetical protein